MSAPLPPLALALQGGGAHGAFTWGVLDRLLDEPDFTVEAVSATSSGALNALALAQGWMDGGREGARTCLRALWESTANRTSLTRWAFQVAPGGRDTWLGLGRYLTPEQFNPLGFNPIRDIAEQLFDFERLRREAPFAIYVAATRVRDGALELFGQERLSVEAALASTCLPQLFAPVEIDGEHYWDGGWAGNPALEPLVYRHASNDILCVLVQPLSRARLPVTPAEIATRVAELSFSTTFLRELEALRRAREALAGAYPLTWLGHRFKTLRTHLIEPGDSLDGYHLESRINTRLAFLEELREQGRRCAEDWLTSGRDHPAAIG
ncbi:patatin-like phospholipase family protein [Dokdonella koreensis]|uniref:Patatin n=1 Tax=Dokdonella koreensis DS-123 TaxID=1300342 RepID=A0A160DUT5_9GAMM|nr:patatin-like phospholipase family protein [Dokdonella koreensis]ANB17493.1 Patatin [Dokdonella koreensis DS-123]